MCVCLSMCACVYLCVPVYVCVCACVCVRVYVRACVQQGLRTLQDLAPEMRLAMACDLEDEEAAALGDMGDEVFNSEGKTTSVTNTPCETPLPPPDPVEETAVYLEDPPKLSNGGVITEQVAWTPEHLRPDSLFPGMSVVIEQPVMSESTRWDEWLPSSLESTSSCVHHTSLCICFKGHTIQLL